MMGIASLHPSCATTIGIDRSVIASEAKQSIARLADGRIASSPTLPCANASRLSQAMTAAALPEPLAEPRKKMQSETELPFDIEPQPAAKVFLMAIICASR